MNPSYILWPVVLVALFWLMILRPQRNARRKAAELSQSLDVGDEVVTIGGLYGNVVSIGDGEVELDVAEGVVLRFARRAIAGKIPTEIEDVDDDEIDDDELDDDEIDDDDQLDEPDDVDVIEAAPNADDSSGR